MRPFEAAVGGAIILVTGVAMGTMTAAVINGADVQFEVGGFAGTILAGLGVAWLTYYFTVQHYLVARRREEWIQRYVDRGLDVLAEAITDDLQSMFMNLKAVTHLAEAVRLGQPEEHVRWLKSLLSVRPTRMSVQYFRVRELFGDEAAPLASALLGLSSKVSNAQDSIVVVAPAYLERAREIIDDGQRAAKVDRIAATMEQQRTELLHMSAQAPILLAALAGAVVRYGMATNRQFDPARILEDRDVREVFDAVVQRLKALVGEPLAAGKLQ